MHSISVAAAALNQLPLDWPGNEARIREALRRARGQGAALLCLPELCLTGYGCEDMFYAAGTREGALAMLERLLPETRGRIASFGLPLLFEGALYNVACLAVDGRAAGFVAKQHLAGHGVYYEPRWFKPWPAGKRAAVSFLGRDVPLGDLFFDCGGVRIGFEICEDAWVTDRPGARLAQHHVDLILNPSASHFAFGKSRLREKLVLEGSRAFRSGYLYANLLGNESGRLVFDGDTMIARAGEMIAQGPRLSFEDVVVTAATLPLDPPHGADAAAVRADFTWPEVKPIPPQPIPGWEKSASLQEEEFTRAVALGLFDYLRKSRSRGFALSLSGGADSAAVACLIGAMLDLATAELGTEGLAAKLPFLRGLDRSEAMRRLLTCVYQSSAYSSSTTRNAAQRIAGALGARFLELDVAPLIEAVTALVSESLGRAFDWKNPVDDLALQNVQARVRSPGIWMIANAENRLLLSTSNRSEAAIGYATMDGDTSGGLAPIAGIDKTFLCHWLTWMEKQGPEGLAPLPALAAITCQAPTAELRPADQCQTDEADLMPYVVLNAIEKAAIRDRLTPVNAWRRLTTEFSSHTPAQLAEWIERFFRLWSRNQWKRERYAPSFHLDDENLDPKTWCRFPILSGGFETELEELRRVVEI